MWTRLCETQAGPLGANSTTTAAAGATGGEHVMATTTAVAAFTTGAPSGPPNCSAFSSGLNTTGAEPIQCLWYSWIVAVVAVLLASTASNAGFNLQKLALKKNKDNAPQVAVKSMWAGGLACIVLGAVGDVVALAFGDVTLVTPLGVFTLVANIFFAGIFHGEKLCVLVTAGVAAVVASRSSAVL